MKCQCEMCKFEFILKYKHIAYYSSDPDDLSDYANQFQITCPNCQFEYVSACSDD